MTKSNSDRLIIFLVILIIVLGAFFTWQVMAKESASKNSQTSQPSNLHLVSGGHVSIDIQPQQAVNEGSNG